MSEPLTQAPKAPTVASLREQARALYVSLAEYRASTDLRESEVDGLDASMKDAAGILEQLDVLTKARKAVAEQGS